MFDWSKLKAFAEDKMDVTQKKKKLLRRVENIVGKREHNWYSKFSHFPMMFPKDFFQGHLIPGTCG